MPTTDLQVLAPAEISVESTEAKRRWNKAFSYLHLSNWVNATIFQQIQCLAEVEISVAKMRQDTTPVVSRF